MTETLISQTEVHAIGSEELRALNQELHAGFEDLNKTAEPNTWAQTASKVIDAGSRKNKAWREGLTMDEQWDGLDESDPDVLIKEKQALDRVMFKDDEGNKVTYHPRLEEFKGEDDESRTRIDPNSGFFTIEKNSPEGPIKLTVAHYGGEHNMLDPAHAGGPEFNADIVEGPDTCSSDAAIDLVRNTFNPDSYMAQSMLESHGGSPVS